MLTDTQVLKEKKISDIIIYKIFLIFHITDTYIHCCHPFFDFYSCFFKKPKVNLKQ